MDIRPGDKGTTSVGFDGLPDEVKAEVEQQGLRRGAVQASLLH